MHEILPHLLHCSRGYEASIATVRHGIVHLCVGYVKLRISLTSYTLLTPFLPQAQSLIRNDSLHYDPSAHEEEPPDMQPGITIQHLTKIYNQVRRTASPVNITNIAYIIFTLVFAANCLKELGR